MRRRRAGAARRPGSRVRPARGAAGAAGRRAGRVLGCGAAHGRAALTRAGGRAAGRSVTAERSAEQRLRQHARAWCAVCGIPLSSKGSDHGLSMFMDFLCTEELKRQLEIERFVAVAGRREVAAWKRFRRVSGCHHAEPRAVALELAGERCCSQGTVAPIESLRRERADNVFKELRETGDRETIGGAALELAGRALPPACPAEVTLLLVRGADGNDDAPAYASADRVSAAEGARFEVYAGEEGLAAEGAFARRNGGWRVEFRRPATSRSRVAEVLVLAEGGVLIRARARASAAGRMGCATRLEGIPEEEEAGPCECGACGDEWEMVGHTDDEFKEHAEEVEAETMRWALEMGAWAVCVRVGLLATARRFSRRRPALR
ncbi:uncharacterized protein [Triticum aestivum]|uniref:uncharacterized protein n=1 Tax=Triticum aestivum TaxID=4565 RepID=UPI001D02F08C|nr:uncharacterized protein LOC123121196 [Triticum aestivum]